MISVHWGAPTIGARAIIWSLSFSPLVSNAQLRAYSENGIREAFYPENNSGNKPNSKLVLSQKNRIRMLV